MRFPVTAIILIMKNVKWMSLKDLGLPFHRLYGCLFTQMIIILKIHFFEVGELRFYYGISFIECKLSTRCTESTLLTRS